MATCNYQLKTPYGTTHVIFEPLDFIARLVALVPKPRVNLTRFARIIPDTRLLRRNSTRARSGSLSSIDTISSGVDYEAGKKMKIYKGGCHCGLVRFEFRKVDPIDMIMDCNCSICQMKGLVHTGVEDEEMTIVSGEAELTLYQFGSKTAKYWFCPRCGVNPFNRSRTNPHRYTVNVRCLDDFDDLVDNCGVWFINGRDHPLDRDSEIFEGRTNPIRANAGPVPSSRIVMRPRRG